MKLWALSGVDSSGKSTLARSLQKAVQIEYPEMSVSVLWLRYNPRGLLGRPTSATSTVASDYRSHPLKRVLKAARLSPLWTRANTLLYARQLAVQLEAVRQQDIVIADRYVIDFLADLRAANMVGAENLREIERRLPTPDLALVVDVDDDTLRARFKLGDQLEVVLDRAESYRELAALLGVRRIDGTDPAAVYEVLELVGLSRG